MNLTGGGSAGSPYMPCGGCSLWSCGSGDIGSHGAIATGGGGVGSQSTPIIWHFNCCNCVCPSTQSGGCQFWRNNCPGSASGGGGSHGPTPWKCRSWEGICEYHYWMGGAGGPGGCDIDNRCDPMPNLWHMMYPCSNWRMDWNPKRCDPARLDWWDIGQISGAGAPGFVNSNNFIFNCVGSHPSAWIGRPSNSGEGAGTGGFVAQCCESSIFGDQYPYYPTGSAAEGINWQLVCCLGQTADPFRCDAAYTLKDKLVGNFITCAGTLGGSGGVGICGFSSKAGFGGGGGMAKCHLVCVCWGGTFNNFNGGATPLAFPPCILDNLISNAGSGLAIIYYKE